MADTLDSDLDRIIGATFRPPALDTLYHYTSWPAFQNILSQQRLRSTFYNCMNDQDELLSVHKDILEVAEEMKAIFDADPVQPALNVLTTNYSGMSVDKYVPGIYITSFSRLRAGNDQLWDYADKGRGVCGGFRVLGTC